MTWFPDVGKYETDDYFIFLDNEVMKYENIDNEVWTFTDVRNGHMLFFDTEKEAYEYLKEYHKNEVQK
tara:strand:+ start:1112 stop:1315 length:204 start_codon:yes stop_codon:yes gene_type:complete